MQPANEAATGKTPPQKISPETFAFETRFVVLNYIGQVPSRSSSEGSSSGGSGKLKLATQSSSSSGSSHNRPHSVSPRPPSVSPRPQERPSDEDLKLTGGLPYDAKLKPIYTQARREQSLDEALEVQQTNGRESNHQQITLSATTNDETKDIGDGGRRKISNILEKRTREAQVLQELRKLAESKIDEIRATYDSIEATDLEKQKNLESEEKRRRRHQDHRNQHSVVVKDYGHGDTSYSDATEGSILSPDTSSQSSTFSRGDSQFSGRMIPLVHEGPVKPESSLEWPTEVDVPKFSGTLEEPTSPNRPSKLDGLHKASDLFDEREIHGTSPASSREIHGTSPARSISAEPTVLDRSTTGERHANKQLDSTDDSPQRRGIIPRPPFDKSPRKDSSLDSDSDHAGRRAGTSLLRDGSSTKPLRLISKESDFSDMDSPSSETSDLTWSGRSVLSSVASQRSSVVNMCESEVKALVRTSVLPEIAVPLQEELNEQWQQWEKEYEKETLNDTSASHSDSAQGMSPMVSSASPISPESEVARKLAIIGDRIQEEMGDLLDKAFNDIMAIPREEVTYEVLNRVVEDDRLLEHSTGWRQVAVLLAFSQRITVGLLQKGERGLGKLMDYSVRLIEDRAAEFILNQGGWSAISELDVSPMLSPTEEDGPEGTSSTRGFIEPPVEPIGMNAVGSLLRSPSDDAPDASGAQGAGDQPGVGVVETIGQDLNAAPNGDGAAAILVTDGVVSFEIPAEEDEDVHAGDVTPDLVRSSSSSAHSPRDIAESEIRMMRSISHELSREAEEAHTHRFITRLTWGSIAAVVFAVGLTLLLKWKPQNSS